MSWQATYDPLNTIVPNVITAWQEVDAPSGAPNTVNDPDISQIPGADYQTLNPVGNSTINGKALVPFTAMQSQAWAAALLSAQKASVIATSQGYLTGADPVSIFLQALIQTLPTAQGQTAQNLSSQISQNIATIANATVVTVGSPTI